MSVRIIGALLVGVCCAMGLGAFGGKGATAKTVSAFAPAPPSAGPPIPAKSKAEIFREAVAWGRKTRKGKFGDDRETYWYLLGLYGLGDAKSIAEANRILDTILPPQGTPSHPGDGGNGFTHVAAVELFLHHRDKMPPDLRERARADLAARVAQLADEVYPARLTDFNLGHTNYAAMKLEALILGSELTGNAAAQQKGYRWFNEFVDYTIGNGITEFNTTTYAKINLRCWGNIATRSANPQIRRRAAALTELGWLDLAIHYWPHSRRLTGANARTYDHLGAEGGSLLLVDQFLTGRPWTLTFGEEVFLGYLDYLPPAYLREIASHKVTTEYRGLWMVPKMEPWRVGQGGKGGEDGAFGNEYGKDRYTYIEPRFALGTGGAHYAYQDRMLVGDFGTSDKPLNSISAQIDTRVPLDYSGNFLDFLGNQRHIPLGSAEVQDKGVALMLCAVNGKLAGNTPIVAPLLLFPRNVEKCFVNETPTRQSGGTQALAAGDVLFLQEGAVYAALRCLPVTEGFAGYLPTYHYRADMTRGPYQVGALMTALYSGTPRRLSETGVRAGFVVEMATRDEYPTFDAFRNHIKQTRIEQTYQNGIWDVRYTTLGRTLRIRRDVARDVTLDKWVGDVRVEPPMFATNFAHLTSPGIITVQWQGKSHQIDLRGGNGAFK